MATVAVPAAWIVQGTLPGCCARHGGPSTQPIARRFDTKTPLWLIALVPFSFLIALVVALAMRKSIHGRLPGCERCVKERKQFVLLVIGAWVADVVLLVASVKIGSAGLLLWLLVTLGALIWSFAGGDRNRPHGPLSKDLWWVELKGVSDEFAAAINAVVHPELQQPLAPPEPVAQEPVAAVVPQQPAAPEPVAPQVVAEPEPVAPPEPVVQHEPEPEPEPAPAAAEPPSEPLYTGLATRPTVLPKR